MHNKVFLFSDLYLPTFPFLEVPLYEELKRRGLDVSYVLQEGDIRLTLPHLSKVYSQFAITIKKPKHIFQLMGPKDILVCRFGYKGVIGDLITKAVSSKRQVVVLDPAAVDIAFRECRAQHLTLKSPWIKKRVIKKFPRRKSSVFTTGTIHFDSAWSLGKVDKLEFMKSYGLDTNKKLVILCKASQGEIGHQKGVDNEYKQIVNIVKKRCPDYELLFKCHPIDHLSEYAPMPGIINKNQHYKNRPSWETLFPEGIKVVRPEEGYLGFKCADVILNVRSSIGLESMLFPTPLINVNSHKYLVNWPKSNDEGVMKFIRMESLEKTLSGGLYKIDDAACKRHVLEYCDPVGDGRAYIRVADVIEGVSRK